MQGGFVCKETGKVMRDSISYLDHINGKKQQKMLGMSMRVERSNVHQVSSGNISVSFHSLSMKDVCLLQLIVDAFC